MSRFRSSVQISGFSCTKVRNSLTIESQCRLSSRTDQVMIWPIPFIFPRFGKMKGMGQIITWSVRDESLHCDSIVKLFRTFVQENPEIWTEELKRDIYLTCATIVDHEDAFIELAFEQGSVEGLTAREVREYIRYIADRRLQQLGLNPLFQVAKNPLPWLDEMLNAVEHTNFFENRATEYSKASTVGTWEEAFADTVFPADATPSGSGLRSEIGSGPSGSNGAAGPDRRLV